MPDKIKPMTNTYISKYRFITIMLLGLALSACRPAQPATPQATPTAFPTYGFVPPTEAPSIVTIAAETATAVSTQALDPDKVALGKSRYVALECGSCHGDQGQGTAKGSVLAGTKMTEDEFISFLRSGGKLGNDHLYSTNRLSDAGGKNLYLYVLSLTASGK